MTIDDLLTEFAAQHRVPNSGRPPKGWPEAYTDNGVLIVPGLRVRDYNWRETTVARVMPTMENGVGDTLVPWFSTANGGMFDGSRLFAL